MSASPRHSDGSPPRPRPQGVVGEQLRAGLVERRGWIRLPDSAQSLISVGAHLQSDTGPPMGLSFLGLVCLPVVSITALERWLKEHAPAMGPGGALMVATLGPGTLLSWRRATGMDAATEPRGLDLHDLGDLLSRAGFAAPVTESERIVLSYQHFETAMRDLHGLWVPQSGPRLHGRSAYSRRRAEFEQLRAADGRVHLEFELVFAHGWRGEPRRPSVPRGEQPVTFQSRGRFV